MSVIRIVHNRENPYVLLNKQALWNKNLSLKATGLWARCLSRPDNWEFNINEMAQSGKEGKRALYCAIDELIAENYAVRVELFKKETNGKFSDKKFAYIFFEFPPTEEEKAFHIEELKKFFRRCGFGDLRNAPLINKEKELSNKKEIYKEKEMGAAPPKAAPPKPPPLVSSSKKTKEEKKEVAPRVSVTPSQENALIKRLKGSNIALKTIYEERSAWKIKNEIWGGRSDYTGLCKWIDIKLKKQADAESVDKEKKSIEEKNKVFMEKVKKLCEFHPNIRFHSEDIEFKEELYGRVMWSRINIKDNAFEEMVINLLRKLDIDVNNL